MLLVFIEAMKHFALILALLYLYAQLLPRFATYRRSRIVVLQSILFGAVAIISMFISTPLATGHYTDSRTVIVMTAAASAGPIPGFIAAIFATIARCAYPLDGFMNGTVSVVVAAVLGSLYYRFEQERRIRGTLKELLLAGVVLGVVKIVIMLAFAGENQMRFLAIAGVPAMVLFPLGFVLSFLLLRRELRQFEDSRRSTEYRHQFDVAIQSSPIGIVISRLVDHRCVYANEMAARALGTSVAALIGQRIPLFESALGNQGSVQDHPVPFTLPGGEARWFHLSTRPVQFENQACQFVTVQDVTERKQAEAQQVALAVEQQKVRTLHEFIRTTSHDLRTPLAVINTSLYLAQKTDDKTRQMAQLRKAESQVTVLSGILDGIYDWVQLSHVEALTLRPVDVNPLLTDLIDQAAPQLNERHLSLTLELDPALPRVAASQTELNAAFQALVSNAITYTPPDGQVTLRSYTVGQDVRVEIADTGIGIDSESLDRIFEPFYKADPARNTGDGGAGLGLTIARRIIDLHHGTMALESHPGSGTTARVTLQASGAINPN